MDDLIEIVLEIVLEGAMEATGSKKVPLPLRVALGAAVMLFFYGIAALVIFAGVHGGSFWLTLLGAAMAAGFTGLAASKIRAFHKR